ncbi:MAG: ABC transporter permease, partial [Anaerolineales bacterium]|nr:ABC transporter permease [Anaerolineales bacterium]
MLYLFPFLTPLTLALRNMRTRLGRTLLTLLGIVLGVAVVLAIQITNQSTLDSIRQVFDRAAGQADLLVVPTGATGDGITPDLLAELEVLDGVQVAAPAVMAQTWLAAEASSWQIAFTASGTAAGNVLQLYGIDPTIDQQVRVYELSGGRMPYPEEYEAILPASFAAEKDLSIGDDLVILTPLGNERLEIVGLLADQGVALLNGGVVAFAPLPVVQELFALGDEVAEVSLRTEAEISTAPKALQAFKEQLEAQLPQGSRAVYPAARGQLVSRMLATYQQGLSFFSMIAIFVGAFLIYNTFSMTIVERTREIGMLRAIGMSRRKVIGMVLAEALFLALIGSLIGLAAGVVLARGLMTMTGAIVDTGEQAFTISRQGILQSLLVGLGVTLGAALLPAIQAARTSPLTALRVRARSGEHIRPTVWLAGLTLIFVGWAMLYKLEWRPAAQFPMGSSAILLILLGATLTVPLVVVLLERATRPLATILYGNEGRIGTSNVRRSVGRTTLTVASLMVALAMVIGIGSLAHAFEQDMASWVETALGGDLYVRSPLVMRTSFGRQLENLPGVAAVSAARYINVRVAPEEIPADSPEDDTMIFIAIDPNTFRQ